MNTMKLLLGLFAATLIIGAGCSKKDETPTAPKVNGVTVDIPKLNQAFADAGLETKRTVTEVGFNIRYQKYEEALMSLDKLANDPNVTEEQKKVVNQLIGETKQLAGAAPAAPAQ